MPNTTTSKDRITPLAEHAIDDIDTVIKAIKAKNLQLDLTPLEHAKKDCEAIKADNHAPQ
jgi:hypothetical protein